MTVDYASRCTFIVVHRTILIANGRIFVVGVAVQVRCGRNLRTRGRHLLHETDVFVDNALIVRILTVRHIRCKTMGVHKSRSFRNERCYLRQYRVTQGN